jgi:DDE superfamily endonuclease
MPRRSPKQALKTKLRSLIKAEVLRSILDPALFDNAAYHGYLGDLRTLAKALTSIRYLSPRSIGSAGRLPIGDVIGEFLRYPESGFLVNFRMKPDSFWALVELLERKGGDNYWCQNSSSAAGGSPGRPVFQQVAVALYVLGSAGATLERIRMKLNIGKGTIQAYLWRTVNLLASLSNEYVRWPSDELRRQQRAQRLDEVFGNCVGHLDGSEIPLRDRPLKDPEAYFSRKKTYGFNLQAICNQQGQFIYAHAGYTASTHDSTAFKATSFYQRRRELMSSSEYILADKAYQLDKHIITPYKLPIARQPSYKAFNLAHSRQRIKVEHTFGVLKARWSSLRCLPVRIRDDVHKDHTRVIRWLMACLVLHNFLSLRGEDNDWLEAEIEVEDEGSNNALQSEQAEAPDEMKLAGENRRNSLREELQEE